MCTDKKYGHPPNLSVCEWLTPKGWSRQHTHTHRHLQSLDYSATFSNRPQLVYTSQTKIMHHHPSERERMHRLSVVYAMVGLFFGCLSAALIIVSIRPMSRTVVVFAPMEQVGPAASTVLMDETRGFRGHRRLTDEMAIEEVSLYIHSTYIWELKKAICIVTLKTLLSPRSPFSVDNNHQVWTLPQTHQDSYCPFPPNRDSNLQSFTYDFFTHQSSR